MKRIKKILIMGLPGSGKTTLAKKVTKMLRAKWLNADQIRGRHHDWDFSKRVSFIITLYGFFPSLFALVILILKINYFIFNYIFYFLILFLVFQIILEYFLIYSNLDDKTAFYKVRVPLTTIIIFSLIII